MLFRQENIGLDGQQNMLYLLQFTSYMIAT